MKHKHRIAIAAATIGMLALVGFAREATAQMSAPAYTITNIAANEMYQSANVSRESETPPTPEKPVKALTHAQEVWLGALEWCESHGDPTAINKKDRDGTPSYGAFQFKPGTLNAYAKQYSIDLQDDYMLYGYQKAVVTGMVLDRDHINWNQQFPDCVKRLGKPPIGAKI